MNIFKKINLVEVFVLVLGLFIAFNAVLTSQVQAVNVMDDGIVRNKIFLKMKGINVEAFEKKAEAMNMTVEEFKKHLMSQNKFGYKSFRKKVGALKDCNFNSLCKAKKLGAHGMTIGEHKIYFMEQYEAKAEAMNMTVEEFKTYLGEQRKAKHDIFIAEAEAKGMTFEEHKKSLWGHFKGYKK